jgi:hypothetical protein
VQIAGRLDVETDLHVEGTGTVTGMIDVAGRVTRKAIVWSGGCTSHGNYANNVWKKYCLDGLDFETAITEGYVSVDTAPAPNGGNITILKPGVYNFKLWVIAGTSSAEYNHLRFFVNGQQRTYTYEYNSNGAWNSAYIDIDWPLAAGDVVHFEGWDNVSGYAWHAWNSSGNHSRLQFYYVGE